MIEKADNPRTFIQNVIYPMYQKAQIERWNTENVSEGQQWKALNPGYAKSKLRRFAAYPYSGTKVLVATGTLLKSVVGSETRYHRKIVTNTGLLVSTTVEYARDVSDVRPFMKFDKKGQTYQSILKAYKGYISGRS